MKERQKKKHSWATKQHSLRKRRCGCLTGFHGKVPKVCWFGFWLLNVLFATREKQGKSSRETEVSLHLQPVRRLAASFSGGRLVQAREGNAAEAAAVDSRRNNVGSQMQRGEKHLHTENPQARRSIELFIVNLWLSVTFHDPRGRQAQWVKLIKTLLCIKFFP